MSAQKLQHKAAKVGFDWDKIEPVWAKLQEEVKELQEAVAEDNKKHIEEELGDVLFTVVNLARFMHVDAEIALIETNKKFKKRFTYVEQQVNKKGGNWADFTLKQLDEYWDIAKKS